METEHEEDSQEQKNLNIIQVEYDENYEVVSHNQDYTFNSNLNSSSSGKGKYYKQTYRPAWEHMPDFEGWLRGVQGEPTRAYCTYCQKTLHAHRLSLLKHTCTIRHQKAAQLINLRNSNTNTQSEMDQVEILQAPSGSNGEENEIDENDTVFEYGSVEIEDGENEAEQEEPEEEEDVPVVETVPVKQKQSRQVVLNPNVTSKPPISTYVIDSTRGVSVIGLQVSLYKLISGRWTYINEGVTNQEGKFNNFLERSNFTVGRYKLHFDVDRYFESRKTDTQFPFIEVVVDCKSVVENYDITLLISPFGYTTYKS